jgi:hypothetical protein
LLSKLALPLNVILKLFARFPQLRYVVQTTVKYQVLPRGKSA